MVAHLCSELLKSERFSEEQSDDELLLSMMTTFALGFGGASLFLTFFFLTGSWQLEQSDPALDDF